MHIASEDPNGIIALERGRKSVRDGAVGNPYPVGSTHYDQFDQGVDLELRLHGNAKDNHGNHLRVVA